MSWLIEVDFLSHSALRCAIYALAFAIMSLLSRMALSVVSNCFVSRKRSCEVGVVLTAASSCLTFGGSGGMSEVSSCGSVMPCDWSFLIASITSCCGVVRCCISRVGVCVCVCCK